MSITKRAMEQMEDQRRTAISIATQAGVLEECEHHDGTYFDGGEDIQEAYKLANTQFSAGEFGSLFESRRELTDLIKDVVEELADPDGCSDCAHIFGDD